MSEQGEKVEHPSWCVPDQCTAPEFRPTESVKGQTYGEHVSQPLVFPGYAEGMELRATLTQSVTPWGSGVFLRFRSGNGQLSWMTEMGTTGIGFDLFELMAQPVADQARRFPVLYEERFGWVADHQFGDADQVAGVDPEMFPEFPAEDVWQDAPAPDPATRVDAPAPEGVFLKGFAASVDRVPGWDAPCDCGATEDPDGETMCTCSAQRAAAAAEDERRAAAAAEDEPLAIPRGRFQLTVNDAAAAHGTFQEIQAAVAELATGWLADDPEGLAIDAQMLHLAFTSGSVREALDEGGEWHTMIGVHSPHATMRVKVTREA